MGLTSIENIENPISHIKLRTKLWKDVSSLTPLSVTKTPQNYDCKIELAAPTWIKRIDVRFPDPNAWSNYGTVGFFHVEVSDTGAYSTVNSTITAGVTQSVVVTDITGFEVGEDLILRNSYNETDKQKIVGITGNTIYFSGYTKHNYVSSAVDTVSDTRWFKVVSDYIDATSHGGVHSFTFDTYHDDRPIIAVYGKYFRIISESVYIVATTVFDLYEDSYFDLSPYLYNGIDIDKSVDFIKGDSPLTTCNLQLLNIDDRFNCRNANSPYIVGTINYLTLLRRITVEWIGCAFDWQEGQLGGLADWRLACSFTARNWGLQWGQQSIATVSGETLNRLNTEVDIPLLEVISVKDIIEDNLLMEPIRLSVIEEAGVAVKMRVAVFDQSTLENTISVFREFIGVGTFGVPQGIYSDPSSALNAPSYEGFFGIDADGQYIYTCHSAYSDDISRNRSGAVIIKRSMNCLPVSQSSEDTTYLFDVTGTDTEFIEGGEFTICGEFAFIHTAVQGIEITGFKNVFKLNKGTWSVASSYAKKGGLGHYPVHCVADDSDDNPANHVLYVLYSGGTEGWVLYKCSAVDYSTIWSHSFVLNDIVRLRLAYGGMFLIGNGTLVILTKANSVAGQRKVGSYYAQIYTLASAPPYAAYTARIELPEGITNGKFDNPYGLGGVCLTGDSVIALTGPQDALAQQDKYVKSTHASWKSKIGQFCGLGRISYNVQNGRIANNNDDYTDPASVKDIANFPEERVYVGNELLYDASPVYSGHIKTTTGYQINLLTGEIQFVSPPPRDVSITIDYDYKPNVQYVTSGSKLVGTNTSRKQIETIPRWSTIRDLCFATGGIAYTDEAERVVYRQRRFYEDYLFTSASTESFALRGRHIIHNANTKFTHNTVTVCNESHNIFYVEGVDYTITYDINKQAYTITEITNKLTGHIVVTYLTAPSDENLLVFDNTGRDEIPNALGLSQGTQIGDIINTVIVTGQHKFPSSIPMTLLNTYAVSPSTVQVEHKYNKMQIAHPESQYLWNPEKNVFDTADENDISASGFIVEFSDPLIVGTPAWTVIEPDVTHVEKKTITIDGTSVKVDGEWVKTIDEGDIAFWVKIEWDQHFTEPNSTIGVMTYDVALSNPDYWRVGVQQDAEEESWTTYADALGYFKSGEYIWVKYFRGGVGSDTCIVYAYSTKSTTFYINKTGTLKEQALTSAENYLNTKSPDKKISITVHPMDRNNNHLFRTPDTYDGVAIPANMCLEVGSIKIGNDGLQIACNNHSSSENFLRVTVIGYPITTSEIISVKCQDNIRLDSSISSMEQQGVKPFRVENQFIQSVAMGKTIGYSIIDWTKYSHVTVPIVAKFRDDVNLLDVVQIKSDYGNFVQADELWLVTSIHHSIRDGLKEMSTTQIGVIDVPDNPSQPPGGS